LLFQPEVVDGVGDFQGSNSNVTTSLAKENAMYKRMMGLGVLGFASFVIAGCAMTDQAAKPAAKTSSAGTQKAGENVLPRIDPKKEKGIVKEGSDVSVELTVRNQTSGEVSLYWLDENTNERVHYHDINAGEELAQGTFEGHYWIILNKDKKALGLYEVLDKDGVIVVKP
jgi:hypothetical protein